MITDVLIVDDSEVFRKTLKSLMFKNFPGMSVSEAGSADEALQKIDECCPQLVFSDIRIQNDGGLDLVKEIRQCHPEIILVVITSNDALEYREAAFSKGADCYIPKSTASSLDIVDLIDSFVSRIRPKWKLGIDYINPYPPAHPWN